MPRRPRTHVDNLPLHIVQRGHNRDACFLNEADYLAYLGWLDEALQQTGCRLHAYILMTNHVHLLITPEKAETVPKLLVSLGRRYVQYFNRLYRRTGTLWDSRYKSSLIDADNYLLTCMRYIELNPVRAGMVNDPAHYRWSSYRSNALGNTEHRLAPHPVYLELARNPNDRLTIYRQLFRSELNDDALGDLRLALDQNQPLGSNRFHEQITRQLGKSTQARPRGRPRKAAKESDQFDVEQLRLPVDH
jgi:putative transposase